MFPFARRLNRKIQQLIWQYNVSIARNAIRGVDSWRFMDALGIPGFGTDLVRIDFLPSDYGTSCWKLDSVTFSSIRSSIEDAYCDTGTLNQVFSYEDKIDRLSLKECDAIDGKAWKANEFLSLLDILGLYAMLDIFKPKTYLEIGSGMSTRVAGMSIVENNLSTSMVCIDPSPRLPISNGNAKHLRASLETSVEFVVETLRPGDVLFFDGSHRSFPGSDVTTFFLGVIPRLQPGVIVHIHDIYLPFDYPESRLSRFWNEQYLLACWLLGGGRNVEIILPGMYCQNLVLDEASKKKWLDFSLPITDWTSFWFRTG
jgi:hypothetical protein